MPFRPACVHWLVQHDDQQDTLCLRECSAALNDLYQMQTTCIPGLEPRSSWFMPFLLFSEFLFGSGITDRDIGLRLLLPHSIRL